MCFTITFFLIKYKENNWIIKYQINRGGQFIKKLWCCISGNITRLFGFIHWVDDVNGHCEDFLKLMFQASPLCQTNVERLTLESSALNSRSYSTWISDMVAYPLQEKPGNTFSSKPNLAGRPSSDIDTSGERTSWSEVDLVGSAIPSSISALICSKVG